MDSLLDRIYNEMRRSERAWSAVELGRDYLKLRAGGPAPEALIRVLLRPDPRFTEESSGVWQARSSPSIPLRRGSYALAWIEAGMDSKDSWRLHLAVPGRGGSLELHEPLAPEDPDAWEARRQSLSGYRLATIQPGQLGRALLWMDRHWALGEWIPSPLDLQTWVRIALALEGVPVQETHRVARLPALAEHWQLGPQREEGTGAPLHLLAAILERLLERFGHWDEEALERAIGEQLATRPIDWEQFRFGPEDLAKLPAASGIYRFHDHQGRLLYVGKAVNLARRVGSYFRPLPPEPSKREALLRELASFEIAVVPSELEALIREVQEIRQRKPLWNVQVEVHPPENYPGTWWWPLLFLAPAQDEGLVSGFLLPGPDRGWMFHLPRQAGEEMLEALSGWLSRRLDGPVAGIREEETREGVPVWALEAPEANLALRYYLRSRPTLHRLELVHFSSGPSLAKALLHVARLPSGPLDVVDQRPSRSVGGAETASSTPIGRD